MPCCGKGKKARKEARLADIEMKIHDAELAILNTNAKVGELNDNVKHALMENARRLDLIEDALVMSDTGSGLINDLHDKFVDASAQVAALEANQAKQKNNTDKELERIRDDIDELIKRQQEVEKTMHKSMATTITELPREDTGGVTLDKPIRGCEQDMLWCDGYKRGNMHCADPVCDPTIPAKVDSLELEKQELLRQLHQTHHLFHQRDDVRNDLIAFRQEINRLLNTLSIPPR